MKKVKVKECTLSGKVFKRLLWLFIKKANKQKIVARYLQYNGMPDTPQNLNFVMCCYKIKVSDDLFQEFDKKVESIISKSNIISIALSAFLTIAINFVILSTNILSGILGAVYYVGAIIFSYVAIWIILQRKLHVYFFNMFCLKWIDEQENRLKVIDFQPYLEKKIQ